MCSFVYENARVNEICDPSEYKVFKKLQGPSWSFKKLNSKVGPPQTSNLYSFFP